MTMPPKASEQHTPLGFGLESRTCLAGVHPDLVTLACEAVRRSAVDFGVCDGARTRDEQLRLLKMRIAKSLDSDHVPLPPSEGGNGYAHAIRVYPYVVVHGKQRTDISLMSQVKAAFTYASHLTRIPFAWGGDLKGSDHDSQTFTLPRYRYPRKLAVTPESIDRAKAILAEVSQ